MYRLKLAWRMAWRDAKRKELAIVAAALIIAVTLIASITFFSHSILSGTRTQMNVVLGGDWIVESSEPIPSSWQKKAHDFGLKSTMSTTLASMLSTNKAFALASIKAVEKPYPLRGEITTSADTASTPIITEQLPKSGEIWLSSRLLEELTIKIGDEVGLGASHFRVSKLLISGPSAGSNWLNIAPPALVNQADVAKTQIVVPGSRVTYHWYVSGPPQRIATFAKNIAPQLTPVQRILTSENRLTGFQQIVNKVSHYLMLVSLFVIILAGVAIALAVRRYCQRHFDYSALMRCLGMTQYQIVWLYCLIYFYIGLIASIIGCLLGFIAQWPLRSIVEQLIPLADTTFSFQPFLQGIVCGFVLLFAFGLPPLLTIRNTPPLRVLRQQLTPQPVGRLAYYGAVAIPLLAFLYWQIGDVWIVSEFIVISIFVLALLWWVVRGLLVICRRLTRKAPFVLRYGTNNLLRHPTSSIIQIIAFTLTMVSMLSIIVVRSDVLLQWQKELPVGTPNYFVINLQPDDYSNFQNWLSERQVSTTELFPMVRGTLIMQNGQPIATLRQENQTVEALNRPLNLSWTNSLPAGNTLVSGNWWKAGQSSPVLSIEAGLAERLNIKLGDLLSFQIAEKTLEAKVVNIRRLEWESFRPNFYILFPEGLLETFSKSYMASFYLPEEHSPLLKDMVRTFPSISIIDVTQLLKDVQQFINKISYLLDYLLIFAILAGIVVLLAALKVTWAERSYETTLLRTLGANNRQMFLAVSFEFIVMGLASALLGLTLTLAIGYGVTLYWLHVPFHIPIIDIVITLLITVCVVVVSGLLGTLSILKVPPLYLLREQI